MKKVFPSKQYKFITIRPGYSNENEDTAIIVNNNSGDELGGIYYYPRWRQWVCSFDDGVFSWDCLRDISEYLREVNGK